MTRPSDSPNCVRSIDKMSNMTISDEQDHRDGKTLASSTAPVRSTSSMSEDDKTEIMPLKETRDLILQLSVTVGMLCGLLLQSAPMDYNNASLSAHEFVASPAIKSCMNKLLSGLIDTGSSLSINLETAVWKKIELNRRKYPASLCKGKAGKYTEYSDSTGITKKTGQSTLYLDSETTPVSKHGRSVSSNANFASSLDVLTQAIREFATERNWTRFHRPRNLALALLGELGELAELVQYKGDEPQPLSLKEHDKLGQEIADVTIYLIRLADVCSVSMGDVKSA